MARPTQQDTDQCTLEDGTILQRPEDNASLIKLVLQHDIACTCREHSPQLYQCRRRHEDIEPAHRDLERPVHRHRTRQQTAETPTLVKKRVYEATSLAHAVSANISVPENDLSRDQKLALKELREIEYEGLGAIDASMAMSNAKMLQMFNIYNRLFFFNTLEVTFSWRHLQRLNRLGQCWEDSRPRSHIEMDPRFVSWVTSKDEQGRKAQRLATLLHEAIHALLQQYACRSCPAYDINVENAHCHGRAFMIIAKAVEEACQRLLGYNITFDIGNDWLSCWQHLRYLPSIHDLRMGRLVTEDLIEQWRVQSQSQKFIVAAGVIGVAIGVVMVSSWDYVISSLPKLR